MFAGIHPVKHQAFDYWLIFLISYMSIDIFFSSPESKNEVGSKEVDTGKELFLYLSWPWASGQRGT